VHLVRFLEKHADPATNGDPMKKALAEAAAAGNRPYGRILLAAGYDPNRAVPGLGVPLILAIGRDRYDELSLEMIADYAGDLAVRGADGRSAAEVGAAVGDALRMSVLQRQMEYCAQQKHPGTLRGRTTPAADAAWAAAPATSAKAPEKPRTWATPDAGDPRHRVEIPLRLRGRAGASEAAVAGAGAGGWRLTTAAASFYRASDGAVIPGQREHILTLAEAQQAADAYHAGRGMTRYNREIATLFGLWPLTSDINPHCLVLGPRLHGRVVTLPHDDVGEITHASLQDFLDALATGLEISTGHGDLIAADQDWTPGPEDPLAGTPFVIDTRHAHGLRRLEIAYRQNLAAEEARKADRPRRRFVGGLIRAGAALALAAEQTGFIAPPTDQTGTVLIGAVKALFLILFVIGGIVMIIGGMFRGTQWRAVIGVGFICAVGLIVDGIPHAAELFAALLVFFAVMQAYRIVRPKRREAPKRA
jgi:hypothetical protein